MIIAKLDMDMPLSCEVCTYHDVTIKGWDEYCYLVGKNIYSALSRPKECPLRDEVDDTYCTDETCETFLRDLNCERCDK